MLPRVPFVSFVLAFVLGILAGDFLISLNYFDTILTSYFETAVIVMIAAVSFWFYRKRKYAGFGKSLLLFLVTSGMLSIDLRHIELNNDIQKLSENNQILTG